MWSPSETCELVLKPVLLLKEVSEQNGVDSGQLVSASLGKT